jgi:DNA repair protein RadC
MVDLHDRPEDLAARLLNRFGSIGRIAQAPEAELRQIAKAGEAWVSALIAVRRLIYDGMREELVRTPIDQDRKALMSYLLMTMHHLSEERMVAIFADAAGNVIAEETIAEGSDGLVRVTPRRVFGRALNLDARRIVLAHNHPSGNPEPSLCDIEHTRVLDNQALMLGLSIDDHLVIGARRVTSMKDRGLY